jgi:hypothetical protein
LSLPFIHPAEKKKNNLNVQYRRLYLNLKEYTPYNEEREEISEKGRKKKEES